MRKYINLIIPTVSMAILFGFAFHGVMDVVENESEVISGLVALPLVVLLTHQTLQFLRGE